MADKKLNEVTKVTDMAYVPVIMADGSIGQIAKRDLASVVAGIMNTSKLFPFMSMSQAPSGDLNNIQTPGTYYLSSMGDYTNNPGFGWCLLVVFKTLYTTQIAIQSTSQQVVLRTYDGTNWSSWVHIDNFGYNSLAELSAGVAGAMGLDVLPYGYHSLTQSTPFTMNIPKNALIMVSEIYHGYHLVLFAQNAKNVVAKLSESSGSPFSVSMSNGTLIVSVSNGVYDIHVSSLSFK